MNHSPNQSTSVDLAVKEVKASDLGGCRTSHDFAEFAKAKGADVKEFKSLTSVEKDKKIVMFSNSKQPFRIEYRKLLMRAFIAMGFLGILILLFAIGLL